MKVRNPKSRFDLKLKKNDFVLEVGGGHNPHPRSNIVVDKFYDSNYHRGGNIKVFKKQYFCVADGEFLPFKDNAFDYVISNHVLEHVENPGNFFREFERVANRGYLETPSLVGEYLVPKKSHKWVILELDNKLVMMEKVKSGLSPSLDFGDLLLYHIARYSIGYRIMVKTYPDLLTVRHEWRDKIDYLIDPQDDAMRLYFTKNWSTGQIYTRFKPRSKFKEIIASMTAAIGIGIDFIKSRMRQQA